MQSLAQAMSTKGTVGTRLRLPYWDLQSRVKAHTKELIVAAGGPGGGKSTLAVNIAMQVDYPVLYFAQDQVPQILSRLSALGMAEKTDRIYELTQTPEGRNKLSTELKRKVRKTLVVQGGKLHPDHMSERIEAMREWIGYSPPLVIIDNIIDSIIPGKNHHDTSFYAEQLPMLKTMAEEQDVLVMALHHVVRKGDDDAGLGSKPMKMTDLLYAGEREAAHVWGVYHTKGGIRDQIWVQVLKQRDGEAKADGSLSFPLTWHPAMGRLENGGR